MSLTSYMRASSFTSLSLLSGYITSSPNSDTTTVQNLTIAPNGPLTVTGNGQIIVTGVSSWVNGSVDAPITVNAGGVLIISGSAAATRTYFTVLGGIAKIQNYFYILDFDLNYCLLFCFIIVICLFDFDVLGITVQILNGGLLDLSEGGRMLVNSRIDFYDGTIRGGTIDTQTLALDSTGVKVPSI